MTIIAEQVLGMLFMAAGGALLSAALLFFSSRAKTDMNFALAVQAACIIGVGVLFFLGAGLASPPDYQHALIPVVFLGVLLVTHWIWRCVHPREV